MIKAPILALSIFEERSVQKPPSTRQAGSVPTQQATSQHLRLVALRVLVSWVQDCCCIVWEALGLDGGWPGEVLLSTIIGSVLFGVSGVVSGTFGFRKKGR